MRKKFLFLFIAIFAMMVSWSLPLFAADVYTVTNVAVDEHADNATEARKKAIENGERIAFYRLIARLTSEGERYRLPFVLDETLLEMVEGFEVVSEKISADRYRAILHITFAPDPVRNFLKAANIRYTEKKSSPILVLPLLRDRQTGEMRLWQDQNGWWDAWNEVQLSSGLMQFVIPLGDLADIGLADLDAVRDGHFGRLQSLADKYHASEILIADALFVEVPDGASSISVTLTQSHQEKEYHSDYTAVAGESDGKLFHLAVMDSIRQLDRAWRMHQYKKKAAMQHYQFVISVRQLEEWVWLKRRLEHIPFIQKLDVEAVSFMEMSVGFSTDLRQDALDRAFAEYGFGLFKVADGWMLQDMWKKPVQYY